MDIYPPPDPSDAVEAFIEDQRRADDLLRGPADLYTDPIGRTLDALEASIEATVLPPPQVFEPETEFSAPAPSAPLAIGPVLDGPPQQPEPGNVRWTELQPPPAARPFFTREGLGPPVYRPRGGRGVGVTRGSPQAVQRICPETNEFVSEKECESCEQYRDWSEDGSVPKCYYDWQEEAANHGEEES